MSFVIADRVRETTQTTGTGSVVLLGPLGGYRPFSVIGDGNSTYYVISAGSQWEVGIGTYSFSANSLARTTVLSSSNNDALVNFAAGVKDVVLSQPSERAVYVDGTTLVASNNAILPLVSGGTGASTAAQARTSLDAQQTLVSGTSIKTVNSTSLLGSGDVAVQPTLVSGSNIKTVNSTSLLGSGDVAVQPTLVSGSNIKTVNGNSLLGSGDLVISGVSTNTPNTLVQRDASGNFSAGTITANLSGNATTATTATTATSATTATTATNQSGGTVNATTISASGTVTLSGGTANAVAYLNGSNVLTTGTGLTTNGSNLGLGLSVSAFASNFRAVEAGRVGNVFAARTNSARVVMAANTVYGSSTTYGDLGVAGNFEINASGSTAVNFTWDAAPAGLGGSTLTFSRIMNLTPTGLCIGNSAPSGRLTIQSASAGANTDITWKDFSGTDQFALRYNETTTNFSFIRGLGELARFNANGVFQINSTNTNASRLVVEQSVINNNDVALITNTESSVFNASVLNLSASRNSTAGNYNFLACVCPGVAVRLYIRDSGNVVNQNNSYGAISDVRRKENIVDATSKLESLKQVRVVNYNLKGETQKQIGVIAQELEQVFPGMVENVVDRDENGVALDTTTKTVKYSVFVPILIKALQEQQQTIDLLRADVAQLKLSQS